MSAASELFERNAKVESVPLRDETVLFNPENNRFCVLNPTAAFIWRALEQPRSVAHITTAIVGYFSGVTREQAEQDIRKNLDDLLAVSCVLSSRAGAISSK